jgi:hypothetical protein
MSPVGEGWSKYETYVLKELQRVTDSLERVNERLEAMRTEFERFRLEVATTEAERRGKIITWGCIAGFAAAIASHVIPSLIMKFLGH